MAQKQYLCTETRLMGPVSSTPSDYTARSTSPPAEYLAAHNLHRTEASRSESDKPSLHRTQGGLDSAQAPTKKGSESICYNKLHSIRSLRAFDIGISGKLLGYSLKRYSKKVFPLNRLPNYVYCGAFRGNSVPEHRDRALSCSK